MMNKREAKAAGREAGKSAATWVFDGNTSDRALLAAAIGILEGDPEVLDRIAPPDWLSGEWAGGSLAELDLAADDEKDDWRAEEVQQVYVDAADAAYWKQLEKEIPRRIWTKARKVAGPTSPDEVPSVRRRQDDYRMNPSKLTRQDFQFIADVVKGMAPLEGHVRTRNQVALAFANALGRTNPRFDKTRFLKACGVTDPFYLNQ